MSVGSPDTIDQRRLAAITSVPGMLLTAVTHNESDLGNGMAFHEQTEYLSAVRREFFKMHPVQSQAFIIFAEPANIRIGIGKILRINCPVRYFLSFIQFFQP